jgi:hypothetical protein
MADVFACSWSMTGPRSCTYHRLFGRFSECRSDTSTDIFQGRHTACPPSALPPCRAPDGRKYVRTQAVGLPNDRKETFAKVLLTLTLAAGIGCWPHSKSIENISTKYLKQVIWQPWCMGARANCNSFLLLSLSNERFAIGRFGHPPTWLFPSVRSVLTYCKHHFISHYIGPLRAEFVWK